MKIKNDRSEKIIEVYAVYWSRGETYFYGLSKGYNGLLAYKASNVKIIDPVMSGDFIFFDDGIFYKPLIAEKLLDDLLEYDEAAYKRFLEILKVEGRIDPDYF
ncbi:hypothetical protein CWC46_12915 [Prodigiosinella confusarubida]|uniref:Uncharacterized protein n=1 Tax=Serratia sp. (strain ATCC 39006) TaxID=104623 RepID=A0A2I5T7T4_SERS3|nr:hypothetical protein [Serratia sp. ATCC 39006]AUH00630.1 hypothetical protein CWC46_12915 [Serratia sp. ATCC 39006]AUH04951.1 hypothetical protein Ser39006_012920 [Serratia sp. ATCC 39006]